MYERPIPFPRDGENQETVLYEAGLLGWEEREHLVVEWRRHFDRAQEPNWPGHCAGIKPGAMYATWLTGAAGRRAHYKWAGIPKSLLAQWTEERRRRRKPQAEAEAEPHEDAARAG